MRTGYRASERLGFAVACLVVAATASFSIDPDGWSSRTATLALSVLVAFQIGTWIEKNLDSEIFAWDAMNASALLASVEMIMQSMATRLAPRIFNSLAPLSICVLALAAASLFLALPQLYAFMLYRRALGKAH
jgi:hypothetical protein